MRIYLFILFNFMENGKYEVRFSTFEILITLSIAIKIDGTVEQVKLVDSRCPPEMGGCRAAIDSAIRAVWQSSPLQNLSSARYNNWKAFQISFDPRDVLGM